MHMSKEIDQLLLREEAQTAMLRVLRERNGEWRKECERAVSKIAELAAELEAKDAELVRYATIIRDVTGQWPTTGEKK
jgi:HD superfamily phosphohydrolase YqeK